MDTLPQGYMAVLQLGKAADNVVKGSINKDITEDLQTKGVLGDVKWFVALPQGHVDICPRSGGSENIRQAYSLPKYERFGPSDPVSEDVKSFYRGPSSSALELSLRVTYQVRYFERAVLEHDAQDDIYNRCQEYIRSEGLNHVEQARKDLKGGPLEALMEVLIKYLDYK